jgi:TatD DNase family protein
MHISSQTMEVKSRPGEIIELADAHCHLDLFEDHGRAIGEAVLKGVTTMVTAGGSKKSNFDTWHIAGGSNVFGVIGIDPASADEEDTYIDEMPDMIEGNKNLVGIGEIGLDAKVEPKISFSRQKAVFERQLDTAKELKLPVVIHSRGRLNDVIQIIEDNHMERVMFHYFEGDEAQAKLLADRGYLISFPPIESAKRRRIINAIDLSNMVTETDSPVVGKTPGEIADVVQYISATKEISFAEVAEKTRENVRGFLNI